VDGSAKNKVTRIIFLMTLILSDQIFILIRR
jgi:hypothetical protein